jgi:hypothetical protein
VSARQQAVAVEAIGFEPRYYTRDNKTGGHPAATVTVTASAAKAGDAAPTVAYAASSVAGTLDANYGKGPGERGGVEREVIALQDVRDVQKAQNGRGWNADGSAYTLDTHATQGVAQREVFRKAGRAMSSSHAETWVEAGVCNTLNTFDNGETRATVIAIEAAQPAYTMFTGDGEVADPITANEGKTYTHEGTTFRMHNCVGEHVGFYPTAGQDFPALNGCSPAVKVGSGGSAGNLPGIAMVFREAVSYTVSAKWAKGSGGYAGQNECDNCVLEGATPLEGTTPLEAPRAVPVEEPDEVLFVAEDEQDVAILLAEMFAPPVEEPDEVLFVADDADEVAIMVAALFATVDAPERPASVSGNGYTLDAQREVSPTLTAKMQGSSGWAPWNEDAHLIPTPTDVPTFVPAYADTLRCRRPGEGGMAGDDTHLVVPPISPALNTQSGQHHAPCTKAYIVAVDGHAPSSRGNANHWDTSLAAHPTLCAGGRSHPGQSLQDVMHGAGLVPVAEAITENHDGRVYTTPVSGALMAGPGGKPGQGYPTIMVGEAQWWDGSGVASTVTTHSDVQRMPDKGHLQCVVTPGTPAVAFSLSPGREGCGNQQKDDLYVAKQNTSRTLLTGCGSEPNHHQGGTVIVHPVVTPDESAVAFNGYQRTEGDAAWPLGASDGRKVEVGVRSGMAVRRLTPTECERLMGFPDGWTAISWRNKPVSECPDGPRYKALGNSMAVNCMRFIGERIVFVDAVFSELEAASEADE